VVVNHDGGEQILRCLRHLAAQRPPLEDVIVVDSGSTDASPDAIRKGFPAARVMELDGTLGPSVARNRGIREARSSHVLLVDDDVYLAPDASRLLLVRLQIAQAVVAVPRLLLYPETELIQLDGGDVHFVGTMMLHNTRQRAAATDPAVRRTGPSRPRACSPTAPPCSMLAGLTRASSSIWKTWSSGFACVPRPSTGPGTRCDRVA
jgi:GT2 family glycosyltransferase